MGVQVTSAAQIQLTCALSVIGELGAVQRIMGGPTEEIQHTFLRKDVPMILKRAEMYKMLYVKVYVLL